MRLIPPPLLSPGMVVARDVLGELGDILLRPGAVLDQAQIDQLAHLRISAIEIKDDRYDDDLVIREVIAEQTRYEASRKLLGLCEFVAEREERQRVQNGGPPSGVVRQAARAERMIAGVAETVNEILEDLLYSDLLIGLATLKATDQYAFAHGIDVALTAALLGRKLWLSQEDMGHLVAGCLVIDIGNLKVPRALLEKKRALSPAEMDEVRQHALRGYQLLSEIGWKQTLSAHVPFQHHERQDGLGYPRRLRGTNRALRLKAQQFDPRLILQLAEIASIADVYDSLTSDRPFRGAHSIASAVASMRFMAGGALNREMVDVFLQLLPRHMLGSRVRLDGGEFQQALAVVVAQDKFEADRPVVQLIDEQRPWLKRRLPTVDLPGVSLTPVPHDAAASPPRDERLAG